MSQKFKVTCTLLLINKKMFDPLINKKNLLGNKRKQQKKKKIFPRTDGSLHTVTSRHTDLSRDALFTPRDCCYSSIPAPQQWSQKC